MPIEKIKILAIDDDSMFLNCLQELFVDEAPEYQILTSLSGSEGIQIVKDTRPALVLLDIRMWNMDGYSVCKQIREFSKVPIIMLSGKSDASDRTAGFQAGADDYVTKPFYPSELIARINAVLKRSHLEIEKPEIPFCCQDLKIDFARCEVTLKREIIDFTATEYKILTYFASHVNQVVVPSDLIMETWGEKYLHDKHLLQVHIGRIRRKLNDPQGNIYIRTKFGLGYILNT